MRTAFVLGGGGARGAYEAGVISYLRDELSTQLGGHVHFDVVCGTSVGAIHACFLAASADSVPTQGAVITNVWKSLDVEAVLRFGYGDVFRLIRESISSGGAAADRAGGLVDPTGLRNVVGHEIPWRRIRPNLAAGKLDAISVSATEVSTGHTKVFVQRRDGGLPRWGKDPSIQAEEAVLGPRHALASAAIPVLFPPVRVGRRWFVDGGLRLNVPLSPALRLGAERVVVVTLGADTPTVGGSTLSDVPIAPPSVTAPFLMGKALNSLMMDRTEQDLDRLRRLNAILEAGTQAYGPGFAETLNTALVPLRNQPVRWVRTLLVKPSADLGDLAADYVKSTEFRKKKRGLARRGLMAMVDRQGGSGADLASYLLFDGGFADMLIDLGRRDARALQTTWLEFFNDEPQSRAESAQRARAPVTVA